jgi:hypothetical protein
MSDFQSGSWPEKQDEAYRLLAHHVLAALYNVPSGGMADDVMEGND